MVKVSDSFSPDDKVENRSGSDAGLFATVELGLFPQDWPRLPQRQGRRDQSQKEGRNRRRSQEVRNLSM